MTNEQKRIACAEELGWKFLGTFDLGLTVVRPNGESLRGLFKSWNTVCEELPDPLNSLNDCELLIEMATQANYKVHVFFDGEVVVRIFNRENEFLACHKTPNAAIVEAFLKWRGRL